MQYQLLVLSLIAFRHSRLGAWIQLTLKQAFTDHLDFLEMYLQVLVLLVFMSRKGPVDC